MATSLMVDHHILYDPDDEHNDGSIKCIMPGKAGTDNLPRVGLNQIAANGHQFNVFSHNELSIINGQTFKF